MIQIVRDRTFWSEMVNQHKDFFLINKKIKEEVEALEKYYQKKVNIKGAKKVTKDRFTFLTYLKNNIDDVLIGEPEKLRVIISESIKYDLQFKLRKKKSKKLSNTIFYNQLSKIFDYEKFKTGPDTPTLDTSTKWTGYHLVDKLQVDVCPYCNRIFTTTYYSKDSGRTRPHLDHYYPRSIYPFLAISLYNLIPSCYSCNSSFKGDKDFYKNIHLHPYENSMGVNMVFTLIPQKNKIKIGGHERNGYDLEFTKGNLEAYDLRVNTKLETNPDLLKAWDNSNKTFHLEEMYQTHKDILTEMIQKSKVYKNEYLDWLDKKYVGSIFKSRAEIEQMITGNYNVEKDFENRPLAKLTHDISKELKLLK